MGKSAPEYPVINFYCITNRITFNNDRNENFIIVDVSIPKEISSIIPNSISLTLLLIIYKTIVVHLTVIKHVDIKIFILRDNYLPTKWLNINIVIM